MKIKSKKKKGTTLCINMSSSTSVFMAPDKKLPSIHHDLLLVLLPTPHVTECSEASKVTTEASISDVLHQKPTILHQICALCYKKKLQAVITQNLWCTFYSWELLGCFHPNLHPYLPSLVHDGFRSLGAEPMYCLKISDRALKENLWGDNQHCHSANALGQGVQ